MILEGLCEKINLLMSSRAISGLQLARSTGLPPTTIKKLRTKENTNPTLLTLIPIAQYFNVSLDYLISDPVANNGNKLRLPEEHYGYPLIAWEEIPNFSASKLCASCPSVVSTQNYGDNTFALRVSSGEWGGFPSGTIIFVAPSISPMHRDYVITAKANQLPTLKQLICEDNERYLFSLSVTQTIRPYTPDDCIFGVIVESQYQFKSVQQKTETSNKYRTPKVKTPRNNEYLVVVNGD